MRKHDIATAVHVFAVAWLAALAPACVEDAKHVDTSDDHPARDAGRDDADDDDAGRDDTGDELGKGPLMPWAVGNSWTYRVTDEDDGRSTKVTTIEKEERVGGMGPHKDEMAFRVVTKKGASDQTISWQLDVGDKVVRYREQSFGAKSGELQLEEHWDPYKLHVDGTAAHRKAGATWLEVYEETKLPVDEASSTSTERDRWTVDSPDEVITVPAGTFHAIVFQKAGGDSLKTYWYVPGVGKVKETGSQTEELVSYEVAE
jgi:hypothetical protein